MPTGSRDWGGDRFPLVGGVVYGTGAFVTGYLVMVLLVVVEGVGRQRIEFAGWLYYNAQFVDVTLDGAELVGSVNYVRTGWGGSVPPVVYHLVPVAVLLTAGFLLASRTGASEPSAGATAGASIVAGTVVLAALGTVLFASGSGSPTLLTGVLLAGVLYPAVFGAIGGVLSAR